MTGPYENLNEDGRPIEAGWSILCDSLVDEDDDVAAMRNAFMAGAAYLMSRITKAARDKEDGAKLMKDVRKELSHFARAMTESLCPQTVALFHPQARDMIGDLPHYINPDDPRPAKVQFNEHYAHGGGWRPIKGFKCDWEGNGTLSYPGDPPLRPIAGLRHGKEAIMFYEHALVCVLQPDGTFEVCRMD